MKTISIENLFKLINLIDNDVSFRDKAIMFSFEKENKKNINYFYLKRSSKISIGKYVDRSPLLDRFPKEMILFCTEVLVGDHFLISLRPNGEVMFYPDGILKSSKDFFVEKEVLVEIIEVDKVVEYLDKLPDEVL